ncbi:TonB family protein [Roseibium alexandrii]|uniref:TonB family C-terminal domain protein n=1 Tax=Roseibium alexandrii (strain DSM 17067 / NCIMB 14079 / DFL-11) TaxID=244592 RepID=A0A5E8H7P4_ROSAD|nr:TonB family protein [Roseibium alexandrii]EEE47423.1 TonB family C-terminal domain protein [Roseibium alexandrii DFL-11]
MSSFRNALGLAICVSLAVHVGAVALTLKAKPELEVAGAGETITITLGNAPFSTISAGSTPQAEASPTAEPAVEKAAPVQPVPVSEVVQPHEPVSVPKIEPSPPVDSVPAVEAVPIAEVNGNFQAVTEQKPVAEITEAPVPEKPHVEPASSVAEPPQTDITEFQKNPVQAMLANDPQTTKEVDPVSEVVTPAELAKPVEPSETVVSTPRRKPSLPKTEVAEAQKMPAKQAAKKPAKVKQEKAQTARRAGAGGQSKRTAQKGGSARKGKAKAAGNSEVTNYPAKVHRKVLRSVRTPRSLGRLAKDAQVRFTVTANGGVSGVRLIRSSGNKAFDQAALKSVQRAAPYPAIPAAAKRVSWTFTLPIGAR